LEILGKALNFSLFCVTNYKEAKAVAAPCVYVERILRVDAGRERECGCHCTRILQDEDSDLVLAHSNDHLRCRLLAEIDKAATKQCEFSPCEFGEIECKGNMTLEPWFDGVPV
jgi:hypothetical protein